MHSCFVCTHNCDRADELLNHIQRHRKADLISALYKNQQSELSTTMQQIKQIKSLDRDDNDLNNNSASNSQQRKKKKRNLRRSCRLRDKQEKDDIEENYYMPPSEDNTSKTSSPVSDESVNSEDDYNFLNGLKKEIKISPIEFSTPKGSRDLSSETDSCSGNTINDRIFCSYCGSGYRTESMLADHIRHQHLNFCSTCDMNIPDMRVFKEHKLLHESLSSTLPMIHSKHKCKPSFVFICPYCSLEFSSRKDILPHMHSHLDNAAVDDVLGLEGEYCSDRKWMNTMYNMFNAGYSYGKRDVHSTPSASAKNGAIGFYEVFLQYATQDFERIEHYGHLCRTCGFTLFDAELYKDHMEIAHGMTQNDVEIMLNGI